MEAITKSTKPITAVSAEAVRLINAFGEKKVGEILTHEEMRDIIKADVTPHLISKVKDVLREELGMVIGSVCGVGYRILSAEDVLAKGGDYRSRMRNSTRRRMNELKTIDPKTLTQPQQTQYHSESTHAAMINFVHSQPQQSHLLKVSQKIRPRPMEGLTLDEVKALFGAS